MTAGDQLPICRYSVAVEVREPLRLPEYSGSMLRGAFGHGLRRLSCMTRQKTCGGCPLLYTCPYPMIFETPPGEGHSLQKFSHMPSPYVIEPPLGGPRNCNPGDTFRFGLVLIGQALDQLALIVLAWERALERGLGKMQSRCRLLSVHSENGQDPVYTPKTGTIAHHQTASIEPLPRSDRASLEFLTPLRLQKNGQRVGIRELDARTLLMTLARRHQLLADGHLPRPPVTDFTRLDQAARAIRLDSDLRWFDWRRYSNRQQQAMTLGGLVGGVGLEGDLEPFRHLLALGQWLHLGKNATFGLGQYRLQSPQ